jgi:hypothetical protein
MKAPQNLKWDKPRGPRWLREVIEKLFRELTLRTPVEGLGVFVDRTDNGSILSTVHQPGGKAAAAAAAAALHPFKVEDKSDGSGLKVSVYPGYFITTVPKIGVNGLDADPAPTYGVTTGTLYFKFTTKQRDATTNDFRSALDTVVVEGRASDDKEQLKIVWTDAALFIGTFYLKIADIEVEPGSAGPPVVSPSIKTITQYLFQSYRSLVIVQDRVVLLA